MSRHGSALEETIGGTSGELLALATQKLLHMVGELICTARARDAEPLEVLRRNVGGLEESWRWHCPNLARSEDRGLRIMTFVHQCSRRRGYGKT